MSLDEEDTKRVVVDFLRALDYDENEFEDMVTSSEVNISDNSVMNYNYASGIPTFIRAERLTIVDVASLKSKRLDLTIIKLID